MKALLYVRVSTDSQDTQRQIDEGLAFIKNKGWELFEIVEDKESGTLLQRTALQSALGRTSLYNVFVVHETSRLTRLGSADFSYIIHHLTHHNVAFVSVTQSFLDLTQPFIRNVILPFLAEMDKEERENISKRTKSKYNSKKAHAEALGQKVNWGRRALPDKTIAEIIEHRKNGMTTREIARAVTYTTKNGEIRHVSHGKIVETLRGEAKNEFN